MLVHSQILDRIENLKKYKNVYTDEIAKPLIKPFDKKKLQAVSYDISMSNVIMIMKNSTNPIDLEKNNNIENLYKKEIIKDFYYLKPNEFILVKTNEIFNMPIDLVGYIRPRTTYNKLGLIMTTQHINPTFKGYLYIGIKNTTINSIVLRKGLEIGQVVFEKLDEKIEEHMLYENLSTSKYQNENEFIAPKFDEKTIEEADQIFNDIISKL